jgi:hypothetical protein
MSEIIKVLEVSPEAIAEAQNVFHTETALKSILEQMVAHGAKNMMRQKKLWNKVIEESRAKGIDPTKMGLLTFDHLTDKFVIVKSNDKEGGA